MAFGGQPIEEGRYDKALGELEDHERKRSFVESLGTSIPFLVEFSIFGLALWYGSTLVVTGEITVGHVFTSFMCVTIGSSGLGLLGPSINTIAIGCGAAYEIFQIIDRKSKIDSLSPDGLKPETCKGAISFKDVEFTYPARPDSKVLKGVSFDIPSGQTFALVGKSGCGKSTIVSLIERFYDVDGGSLSIDGVSIKDLNVKWLRSRIGLVAQEPTLFAGTIAENIAIAKPGATQEEIVAAAKEANAHEFIAQFPEGYNTRVYQMGGNLSGGQKQRIAIARALIQNPQILLLDEATSALDTESERVVQAALEKVSAGLTTIVIAHRLSTIRNADKILVFDQGAIIEQGNHEELLALNGKYANMVHLQSVAATKNKAPSHELLKAAHKVNKPGKDELKERPKPKKAVTRWYVIKKLFLSHWRENWYLNALGTLAGVCQGGVFPILGFVFAHALLSMMLYTGDELRAHLDFWVVMMILVGFGGFSVIYVQNLTFLNSASRFTHTLRYGLFSNIIRQPGFWFDYKGHEAALFESMLA